MFRGIFDGGGGCRLCGGADGGLPHLDAYTYKNLSIFLIHGKDESKKSNIMTLQEAMERKLFVVYETSKVNELEVENLSKEFDVFIQSGDIVKGGKQDRVLAVSIIIPARSGRVKIEAFCVESGRWTKRGNEDAGKFTSSNDRIVTKELKIAANAARSQQEVWNQVSDAQARLSKNVGGDGQAGTSSSSLQLSLENKQGCGDRRRILKNLGSIIERQIGCHRLRVCHQRQDKQCRRLCVERAVQKALDEDAQGISDRGRCRNRAACGSPTRSRQEAVKAFIDDSDKARQRTRSFRAGSALVNA